MAVIAAIAATTLGAGHHDLGTKVIGGTPAQQAMARWAQARFVTAELSLPPLEIRFHPDPSGCHERLGYFVDGVASVCGTHANPMARRTILHEMAHGWIGINLSGAERTRFLELRGLRTWNDQGVAWDERGSEQAAEIMAWALDERETGLPMFPNNSLEQMADGYESLTGDRLPSLPAGT